MAQLLVRGIDDSLVRKLKRRSSAKGVSVEEEHRCILRDALRTPAKSPPSLMEFLLSAEGRVHPGVALDLRRRRQVENHREMEF